MVLEKDIPRFVEWVGPAFFSYLLGLAVFTVIVGGIAWLVQTVLFGPLAAGDRVYHGAVGLVGDLRRVSWRRVTAMTRLAVQESLRKNVLVALGFFAVVLLFAGWFLDPTSVNPGRLYLGFILTSTNLLVCLVVLVLSAFSLPADIKAKAIQTVTTKPVRTIEIVLGRFLGFSAIGTASLLVMGLAGWAFVVRSVAHEHLISQEDLEDVVAADGSLAGYRGRTSFRQGHRHWVELGPEGSGRTDVAQGHRHAVRARESADGKRVFEVGPPEALLEARRPLRGRLTFRDRDGSPSAKGISVGAEWGYRQYIEGSTLAAAVWTFEGIDEREFPDGLPLEMIVRVFRTHKGDIEKGIGGSVRVRNPRTQVESAPFYFTAKEFTIDSLMIPRQVAVTTPGGGTRQVDLFAELVDRKPEDGGAAAAGGGGKGRIEVVLQCLVPAQYFGVAQADFYLLAGNGSFAFNYIKSCLGIWFSMLLVAAIGVTFSTFLSGPVAVLATLSVLLIGQVREFVSRWYDSLVTGDATIVPGGGPIESLYRIITQTSITLELDETPAVLAMKAADTLLVSPMRLLAAVFPSLGSLGTGEFVASGFDIPLDLIAEHSLETLGYVLPCIVLGALFLKAREVAS